MHACGVGEGGGGWGELSIMEKLMQVFCFIFICDFIYSLI